MDLPHVDRVRRVQRTDLRRAPRLVVAVQGAPLRGIEAHRHLDEHVSQPALGQAVGVPDYVPRAVALDTRSRGWQLTGREVLRHPVAECAGAVVYGAVVHRARRVDDVGLPQVALLLARDVAPPHRRSMGGPGLLPGHEPRVVILRDPVVLLVQLEDRRREILVRSAAPGDHVQVDLPAVVAAVDEGRQEGRRLGRPIGDDPSYGHASHGIDGARRGVRRLIARGITQRPDGLREDVVAESVAGVLQWRVSDGIPSLQRRGSAAHAGQLCRNADVADALPHQVLRLHRPRRLEVHLSGDVQPFHRDDAAEVGGVAREANEHPALVGRLNACREISGHPAEEELLLRVVVARPAEREQRVVPRIAVDSALDGAGDRGIGHGIGRAGRRGKTERHRDEQRESEGTTGGEPPGTHGLLRVVRVGGTSQRREPDAYARARHDGASFSGNPACVGSASTCRHPHTNLAVMPALWTNEDSIARSTARAPSRGLARIIHVSARIQWWFVVAVTEFRPSSTRATVMQASSESLARSVRGDGTSRIPAGAITPLRDRARPSLCVRNPAGARWTGGPAPGYASVLCVRTPSPLVRGQTCRARRSPGPRPRRDSCAGRSSAFSSPERSSPSRPPSPAARRRACGPRSAAPSTASPTSWPTTGRASGSAPDTRSPRTTSARSPRRTSRSTGNGPGSSARMGATSRRRWGSASTTWIPTCSSGRSSTRTSSTGCSPSLRRSDRSPPSSRTSKDTSRATTGT